MKRKLVLTIAFLTPFVIGYVVGKRGSPPLTVPGWFYTGLLCQVNKKFCENWPLEPRDQVHHVVTLAGEWLNNGMLFHSGLDIYDSKTAGDPGAPFVLIKDSGRLAELSGTIPSTGECYDNCILQVLSDSGERQNYVHWDKQTLTTDVLNAAECAVHPSTCPATGTSLAAETRVAQLYKWQYCGYNHLHFQTCTDGQWCDEPLLSLTPKEHDNELEVVTIQFTTDDSAGNPSPFPSTSPFTKVRGNVDIVVEARDYNLSGLSANRSTGILKIGYEIRNSADQLIKNSIIDFSRVPKSDESDQSEDRARIIFREPDSNYCAGKHMKYVLTNVLCESGTCNTILSDSDSTKFSKAHAWKTANNTPGPYFVLVTVWDHTSNIKQVGQYVTVEN